MDEREAPKRIDTIVIGGGQAGLATGYHLAKHDIPHLILDADVHIGDAWRRRWDSLRLFTPAQYNGLPGMSFPGPRHAFPTKDQVADFLAAYADRFDLPVRSGSRVERLSRDGDEFLVETSRERFLARNVVVAMATFQRPHAPKFAGDIDHGIHQVHSGMYRNPDQLQDGSVLVVGSGNSGTEIALELAATHQTWMAGRNMPTIPFRIERFFGRHVGVPFVIGFLFHHALTTRTPMGRRLRPQFLYKGGPVVRVKARDLRDAGVERAPKVVGVRDGLPELADGRVMHVDNVVWCTGFVPDFSWIDIPVFDEGAKEPRHERGVVHEVPGLYFVGLFYLFAASSGIFRGVGRDARYVADHLAERTSRS